MCGIAGFSTASSDVAKIDSRVLADALLEQIVVRGRDATGVAWTAKTDDGDREIWYAKQGVEVAQFRSTLKQMTKRSRNVMLHTRAATTGSPKQNVNNHPIAVPGVIGIHNGVVHNHNALIAKHGGERDGEVDSEAIFRLLQHSKDQVAALSQIRGHASIAWMNVDDKETIHLARLSGRPLACAQTPRGSFVFASTGVLLKAAVKKAKVQIDFAYDVPEFTYLRVTNGRIDEMRQIERPHDLFSAYRHETGRLRGPSLFDGKYSEQHWDDPSLWVWRK